MSRRNVQHLTISGISSEKESDLDELPHLEFGAGFPPYLRGHSTTMYINKPWTIRQYAGFSSAEESNAFYKKNLVGGQTGLSLAFDLATHRGYDSDHEKVQGDVGKTGVAIDTVEDMKILFDEIPLDKISVSMTMNGAVLPILAFYIVAAEEQGVAQNILTGTIQNDILKEFMVRNTYIYPPAPSMRIVGDIFEYASTHLPKFNPISISGYHMQEAGATADLELAFTIANGLEYVRTGLSKGIAIDDFAPRLSFFWGIGMNHFTEIAKLRAARLIWANRMLTFQPKNNKSLLLRAHCQTSGWSLTEQDPYNNITRTTIEAAAAVFGGTHSLHTNSFDEAIALPTDYSAQIARNTQLVLREETKITKTVDPWAGSFYVEKLTHDLYTKAEALIDEIEKMGGMTRAIEMGFPNQKIEAAALLTQARIETKKECIVGLNAYTIKKEKEVPHLQVDTNKVRVQQIEKIQKVKQERNTEAVLQALQQITTAAETSNKNLLEVVIDAARKRATLGEISLALEVVFGCHKALPKLTRGVYEKEMKDDSTYLLAKKLVLAFKQQFNRAPKILIAKVGQDGHDRGAKIIASSYTDMGFEVLPTRLFLTPTVCAEKAIQFGADCVGISSLAGGHKTLIPEVIKQLKEKSTTPPSVFVGGIIPKEEYDFLKQEGVTCVFGPGFPVSKSAVIILQTLLS